MWYNGQAQKSRCVPRGAGGERKCTMKKKTIGILAMILAVMCLLAGCGKEEAPVELSESLAAEPVDVNDPVEESLEEPGEEAEEVPEPTPEPPKTPEGRNLLTGLEIDEEYLNRRPVAVMINNIAASQPQCGISGADQIYEMLEESGVTRLMAVYQDLSDVGDIGSIRSARYYQADIAAGLDAVFVHCGGYVVGSTSVINRYIETFNDANLDANYQTAWNWRDSARAATMAYEHTLMTSGSALEDYITSQSSFALEHDEDFEPGMAFLEDLELGGESVDKITVSFSDSKKTIFEYDADSDKYLVYESGAAANPSGGYQIDGNNDEILSMTNVLVCFTHRGKMSSSEYFDYLSYGGDSGGNSYYSAVDVCGSGEALYFSGGEMLELTWVKEAPDKPLYFLAADGSHQAFRAGTSYFCFIGTQDPCTYE